MSAVAFTAQALGGGEAQEMRALLLRGLIVAGLIGGALILLQLPLAALLLGAMGGSAGVTRAAKIYFNIRIWTAPLALATYVVLGWLIGQARARLALACRSPSPRHYAATSCWCSAERRHHRGGDRRCDCGGDRAAARYPHRPAALRRPVERPARDAVRPRR